MKLFSLIALMAITQGAMLLCAQQASPPAGSTGQCKDGNYTSQTDKRSASRGHKGVMEWYAAAAKPAAEKAKPKSKTEEKSGKKSVKRAEPAAVAAPGGGPGLVWVDEGSKTKVYYCAGNRWYGKTKAGAYMSESEAQSAGYHPVGKGCS